MPENHSPWIKQLNRTRKPYPIDKDLETDVLIVGGGIAGVTTAFFTLQNTDKNVLLLEADKVAHGATGHNAGQIVSHFEKGFSNMVEEFGLELATDAQRAVEGAWLLLDEICEKANLKTPIYRFTGYSGYSLLDQVVLRIKNNVRRIEGGLQTNEILVSEDWPSVKEIPEEFKGFYSLVPHEDILSLLETNNKNYIACSSAEKGCTNSALFTEELLGFMTSNYGERFKFFERSPVKKVILETDNAEAEVLESKVKAKKVVLCTNGFENFQIINNGGENIDTSFHHLIAGRIGLMSGYTEPLDSPPTAISYFGIKDAGESDPTGQNYFYLTRRPHEHENGGQHNLVCTGGPEKVLPNHATYSRKDNFSEDEKIRIEEFQRENYKNFNEVNQVESFFWHGLMGYTPNGIRRIGPEPKNPTLLYNLGCNGIGILPSIYGGKKISQFINGEKLKESIFDPIGY